jgi:hypothetical protein
MMNLPDVGAKGLLVNGYGISSEKISNTLIEKLKTHQLKWNNGK